MKNFNKIILLVAFFSINYVSFAHGVTDSKNSCTNGWQWKARSRVTKSGFPTTDKETECNYPGIYPDTWANNNCAHQWAINQWGNVSQGGAVTRWYWICARGASSSDLYYNLVENNLKSKPKGYEQSRVTCKSTTFENNKVINKGIDASFTVLGKDLFSSLEIIMWLPDVNLNYEDSIPTKDKTFWQGKIELINGKVELSGDFPKGVHKITQRSTSEGIEYNVTILDMNLEVDYPNGITNENLIQVTMITDAGVHENTAIDNALSLSKIENKFNLSIYPNPTTDIVTINSNIKTEKILTIELYDINGKLITSTLMNPKMECKFDLAKLNLKPGLFFILIKGDGESQLEKIVYK